MWTATVRVGRDNIDFKIDTGAGVTAITEKTFKALKQPHLKRPLRILFGPAKKELEVLGQFTECLKSASICRDRNLCRQRIENQLARTAQGWLSPSQVSPISQQAMEA